ncbi:MAG: hypothetical protein JXR81_09065 [Candidatus Goldbacteria bacterium]|nr:hypothetical protein [Candidatus Goldiibacteriota bacterium]
MPEQRQKKLVDILKYSLLFFFALVVFFCAAAPDNSNDYFDKASKGRQIVRSMELPDSYDFSYTGQQMVKPETWLSDVLFYGLSYVTGIKFMFVPVFLVYALIFLILFATVFRRQQKKYISIVMPMCLFGAFLLMPKLNSSGAVAGILFTAYFIYVMELRPIPRKLWFYVSLPAAAVLWANTSTTALLAPVIMVIYGGYFILQMKENTEKKYLYNIYIYLFSLCTVSAAILLSPMDINSHVSFAKNLFSGGFHRGFEYSGANILYFILFYLFIAMAAALVIFDTRENSDSGRNSEFMKDVVLVILFLGMAVINAEFIPYLLAVLIPIGAYYLYLAFRWEIVMPKQWTESSLIRVKLPVYGLMLFFTLFVLMSYSTNAAKEAYYPRAASKYIAAEGVPANLFNDPAWGNFLAYNLYPAVRPFISYDEKISEEAKEILSGNDTIDSYIEGYSLNSFLIRKDSKELSSALYLRGYKAAYFDDEVMLLVNPFKTRKYLRYVFPHSPKDIYDKKKAAPAIAELEAMIEARPSEDAVITLSRIYAEQGSDKAIDFLQDALERYPFKEKIKKELGLLFYNDGDYENALETWGFSAWNDKEIYIKARDARKMMKRAE